jgi:hypothetical protein
MVRPSCSTGSSLGTGRCPPPTGMYQPSSSSGTSTSCCAPMVVLPVQPGGEPANHPVPGGVHRGVESEEHPTALGPPRLGINPSRAIPGDSKPYLVLGELRRLVEGVEVARASALLLLVLLVLHGRHLDHATIGEPPDVQALVVRVLGVAVGVGVEYFPGALDDAAHAGEDAPENHRGVVLRARQAQGEIGLPAARRAAVARDVGLAVGGISLRARVGLPVGPAAFMRDSLGRASCPPPLLLLGFRPELPASRQRGHGWGPPRQQCGPPARRSIWKSPRTAGGCPSAACARRSPWRYRRECLGTDR